MSSQNSYRDALAKASNAMAAAAKADEEREVSFVDDILQPVADVADVGLGLASLPPIAGVSVRGLSALGDGFSGAGTAARNSGAALSSFMSWKAADSKRKKEQSEIDTFMKLINGTGESSAS